MPLAFIYETALRQMEVLQSLRSMPVRMQQRELQDILDSAEYVMTMTESLSYMQNVEPIPAAKRYKPEPVNLRDLARRAKQICSIQVKKYGLSAGNITISDELPSLFMDSAALMQVIVNLLTNAIKYHDPSCPQGFSICVWAEKVTADEAKLLPIPSVIDAKLHYAGVKLLVSDNGVGVSVSESDSIFQPRYRGKSEKLVGAFGAGLGLSIVRQILNDHQADVWVESHAKPTVFAVFFPNSLLEGTYTEAEFWTSRKKATQ